MGWAAHDHRLAAAICQNRLFNARTPDDDAILPITRSIVRPLELE